MDDVALLVIEDMKQRREKGIKEYGKPVLADDEDWLQHAYEEALDLTVYLKAELERRRHERNSVVEQD